jgi:outer membrane receptor protein involved in Fe transport
VKGNWTVKTSRIAQFKAGSAPLVLGLALIASPAFAQDAADDGEDTGQDIVVTGSLIENPNLERSTPVNATSADEIELLQSNVAEEILREIPGVVPSIGSAVNNGNGGASFVNLRGLGSNRNVVLIDGVRLVPAELNGRFDLNNVPLALIERVDVLTGGASTTYGADAISGVVNFITRQDFAGLEVNAGYQITEEGDGGTFRVDVTTGANFDDGRGNVVLGIGYQESDPIYQGARAVSRFNIGSFTGAPSGSGTSIPSRFSVPGSGTLQVARDGNSLVPTYAPYNFNPFNIFNTPFERFNIYGAGRYEVSDSVEVYTRGLFSKNTVSTIIAPSGSFGIAVQIPLSNPYLPAGIRDRFCANNDSNPGLAGVQTLTPAQCAAAAVATDPRDPNYREITTALFRRAEEVGPRISEYTTTIFDYRVGARGGITDTISWDVWGSYGESENLEVIQNYTLNSRWRQALRATNTTSCIDSSNGCVPVNVFSPQVGGITPAQAAFLTADSTVRTVTTLAQARGTVSGDVGVTIPWASNPIAFAVGGEYRKYRASQQSDTLASAGDLGGAGGADPNIDGGYDVYEAIGEIVVPLVQDRPFFHDLTLEAGIRYSAYSVDAPTSPSYNTTTWKVGGSWSPVEDFKLRASYARAVRAPNISELFSPQNTGLTSLSRDPCASINDAGVRFSPGPTGVTRDVCLAQGATVGNINSINLPIASQANATSGGNLLLGPETSNSWTLGFVFDPEFIPGLSLTVDYYDIEISGAITTPDPDAALDACFAGANLSVTNPACLVIRRDPLTGGLNGDPATTGGLFLALSNLGALATNGIDFSVNYRRDIGFADLSLALTGNWTDSSTFNSNVLDPSAVNRECVGLYSANCGSIQPEWQTTFRTTLSFENIDVSLLWRHIDSVNYEFGPCNRPAQPGVPPPAFCGNLPTTGVGSLAGRAVNFNHIEAYDYFDLTGRFNIGDNLTMTLTVENLFDKAPPLVGADVGSTSFNSGNTYPSTYDALGRSYAVAVKLKF